MIANDLLLLDLIWNPQFSNWLKNSVRGINEKKKILGIVRESWDFWQSKKKLDQFKEYWGEWGCLKKTCCLLISTESHQFLMIWHKNSINIKNTEESAGVTTLGVSWASLKLTNYKCSRKNKSVLLEIRSTEESSGVSKRLAITWCLPKAFDVKSQYLLLSIVLLPIRDNFKMRHFSKLKVRINNYE